MSFSSSEIDASFYRLIHSLAGLDGEDDGKERRGAPRQPFLARQRIAPCRDQSLPEDSQFVEVPCRDLSRSGFSFLWPALPDFALLVAVFGTPPYRVYVGAEVARCTSVLAYPSGLVEPVQGQLPAPACRVADGASPTLMVLVGCRFTQRLEPRPGGTPQDGADGPA